MLMLAFKQKSGNKKVLEIFPDSPKNIKIMKEHRNALAKAVELGTMSWYSNWNLWPERNISIWEALKMSLEMLWSYDKTKKHDFKNPDNFEPYLEYLRNNNIKLDFIYLNSENSEDSKNSKNLENLNKKITRW